MRVPSPPAMTTAASGVSVIGGQMAGAPGFEPGIAGPKPAALPLGYAPSKRDAQCRASLRLDRLAPEDEEKADDREDRDDTDRDPLEDLPRDRHAEHEQLRRG